MSAARKDVVTYTGAHRRVYAAHGRAADQVCPCGAQAAQWSYDGADLDQQVDDRGRPYSGDPTHYVALCVPCHKDEDMARLGKTARCGTESGYDRHRRRKEPKCPPCRTAKQQADTRRKRASRDRAQSERLVS